MIEIGYNRDAGGAGPGSGNARGCGIVPIDVQKPRGGDPPSLEKSWRHGQPRVTPPGDGALSGTGVNQDEGHLAQRSRRLHEIAMDTGAAEFASMQVRGVVVSDGPDVVAAEAPSPAGN